MLWFCVICNPSPDHQSPKRLVTFLGHVCVVCLHLPETDSILLGSQRHEF